MKNSKEEINETNALNSKEIYKIIIYPKQKGEVYTEEKEACYIAKIGGVTFIVNVKIAEKAKLTTDEFIKALITKECMALEADCA